MRLPRARGPLSRAIVTRLREPAAPVPALIEDVVGALPAVSEPLSDEDFQLALAVCYELHFRGFDDVDDAWEWEPSLLAARARLEAAFETALRAAVELPRSTGDIRTDLRAVIDSDTAPSLSRFLLREATLEQFRDFVTQRSVYHLREADPHTFAIPRLAGRTKAALVEIQSDEYGGGRPERMHSALFADLMRALDLDTRYGAHWERATAATFATVNLMSLLVLHRRHRGAALGHLAVLEMTSTAPNRRYGNGLRRLGVDSVDATRFFDEHVEADAVHEQLASADMCGSFVETEPDRYSDVLWGAACCVVVDGLFAEAMLERWQQPALI